MQNVKKTYNLFLDDVRMPNDAFKYTAKGFFLTEDWVIVRNYDEFIYVIQHKWSHEQVFPDIISFDHDLAEEHYCPMGYWNDYGEWEKNQKFKEKTGMDCAKWLVDFCIDNDIKLCNYYSHSMNPAGRENINGLLNNFKKHQS